MMSIEDILKTEWSPKFESIRKNMMVVSYYKYGSIKENHSKENNHMDAVQNIKIRLEKYLATGNTEFLCDVANFAMIEFMNPQVAGAYYKGTDSGYCEVSGFGVNEIKNFK